MATADIHSKLEEEVKCLFCHGQLDDPRLLECLHVYCKKCISDMRIKSTQRYKCPQCHETLVIEDINKLQPFTLAKVKIRNLQLIRRVDQEDISCDLCTTTTPTTTTGKALLTSKLSGSTSSSKANTALYICTDCRDGQQFLCHSCSMPHYHKPEYKDHVLELVADFHTSLTPMSPKIRNRRSTMAATSMCHEHGLQYHFFCQSCTLGLCNDCLPVHKDHKVIETGDAIENAQKLVTDELIDLVSLRDVLYSSIKPIEDIKKTVEHQEEFIAGEIETRFARINKEFGFCEKKLKNQLKSVSQSKQDLLIQQARQIQLLIEKVDRLVNLMSQAAEMPDETALMSLVALFIEKTRSLKNDFSSVLSRMDNNSSPKIATIKKQVTLVPCEKANMALLLHPESVKTVLRNTGVYIKSAYPPNCTASGPGLGASSSNQPIALQMTYFTVQLFNIHNKPCKQSHDVQVKIAIQNYGGNTFVETPKVIHRRQGCYHVSYCPCSPGQATININVDDTEIQNSPFIVDIKEPSPLSPDASVFSSLQEINSPICIGISGDYIIVYDGEKLIFINLINNQIQKVIKIDELKNINGIDVMKNDSHSFPSHIYVSSSSDHCIAKLNTDNGQVVQMVGSKGENQSQFNTPTGILTVQGEVFVCDSLNHRIQIFDEKDLKYKREINVNLAQKSLLISRPGEPIDITMNENNIIFISDIANSCILMFTSQEKFRSFFFQVKTVVMNSGEPDTLHIPRGVFCDGNGYLYVTDTGNHRIVVYNSHQPSDCILTLGGQKGDAAADLQSPQGLVVDDNGRIFICDTINKRLQVYSDTLVKSLSY